MPRFEVFIPAAMQGEFNVTLRIEADNWMAALKTGMRKLGEHGPAVANIMVDIVEDTSIHVTDSDTRRVFRIKELDDGPVGSSASPPPTVASAAPIPLVATVGPIPLTAPPAAIPLSPAAAPIPLTAAAVPIPLTAAAAPIPLSPAPEPIPLIPAAAPIASSPAPIPLTPAAAPIPLAPAAAIAVMHAPAPSPQAPVEPPTPAAPGREPGAKPAASQPRTTDPAPTALPPAAAPRPTKRGSARPAPAEAPRADPADAPKVIVSGMPAPSPSGPGGPQPASAGRVERMQGPTQPVTGPIGRTKTALQLEDVFSDLFERTQEVYGMGREEGLRFLLDLALEKIPADSGSVFVSDFHLNDVYLATARGPKSDELMRMKLRLPMGVGVVGFCTQEAVGVALSDCERDPRFYRQVSEKIGYPTKSILCAPMVSGGRSFGCVEIINKKGSSHFSDEEMSILNYVAHQGARYLEQQG